MDGGFSTNGSHMAIYVTLHIGATSSSFLVIQAFTHGDGVGSIGEI
jgi:hypothetical protein